MQCDRPIQTLSWHLLIISTFISLSLSLPLSSSHIPHSPYFSRCKFLHDPSTIANSNDQHVFVFDHCTKAKKNSNDHPDRLYHHRQASCRQTNPLVTQNTWEHFSPFRLPDSAKYHAEFNDTYNLVCNLAPDSKVFNFDWTKTPCMLKGDIPQAMQLVDLQRLCIVLRMHDARGNGKHLDFTYEPKDCEFKAVLFLITISYFCLLMPSIVHLFY